MFQDAMHTLQKLGLKPTDIRVLLTCMSKKDGHFIAELCTTTKIKRSTVYSSLKRLLDGGYVTKIRVGNRWKYYAESPESLVTRHEMLLDDLKDLAPLLKRLTSVQSQTEIKFYEGIDGLRKAYESILISMKLAPEGEERNLLGFTSGADVQKVFTDWQKQFINKRLKLGSWFKVIAPESSKGVKHFESDAKNLRESRTIPDAQFPFKIALEICGDSVFIYSAIQPVGGVIIRNAQIAESMRVLFLYVWGTLGK